MNKKKTIINNTNNKSYVWTHVFKNKGLLLIVLFTVILSSAAGMGIPIITKTLIDTYLRPSVISTDIIWIFSSFFGLIIAKVIAMYLISYFGRLLQIRIEFSLRKSLFKHFERINVSYIDSNNEGKVLSRINDDSINIASALRYLPEHLLSIILTSITSFTMVFIYNWIIGFALLGIFIILISLALVIRKKFTAAWLLVKNENEILNQTLANSITGVKETKSYCAEHKEIDAVSKSFDNLMVSWKSNFRLYAKWMTWNTLVLSLISFSILSIGTWQVLYHGMPIGKLVALNMFGVSIIEPINKVLSVVDIISTGSASTSRMNAFLNEPEEDYANVNSLDKIEGEIEFRNVSLRYPGTKQDILKDISFKIPKGQKVAFIGETGSGKSTILKAIIRFYDPSKGKILIDGKDISDYNVQSVRKNITYLQQDSYLFFNTIEYNVAYGFDNNSFESSEKKIHKALNIAKANGFVDDLPEKTQTSVGPKGVKLSGGQKQRLSIARAVLKDSAIVLFDEATSALDNKTEAELQSQLNNIIKGKTSIFIAHRLTTIRDVDRIMVISNGKIVEDGTPSELKKTKGLYWKLLNNK